jgi:hypothetical protein
MLNVECLAGIQANEPETWKKKYLKQKKSETTQPLKTPN